MGKSLKKWSSYLLLVVLAVASAPYLITHFTQTAQANPPAWRIDDFSLNSISHDTNNASGHKDLISVTVAWAKPANTRALISVTSTGMLNGNSAYQNSGVLPLADTSGQATITIDTTAGLQNKHSCDGYSLQAKLEEVPEGVPPTTRATSDMPVGHPDNIAICNNWTTRFNPNAGQGYVVTHSNANAADEILSYFSYTKNPGDLARAKIYVDNVLLETRNLEENSTYNSEHRFQNINATSSPPHNANGYTLRVDLYQMYAGNTEGSIMHSFERNLPHP